MTAQPALFRAMDTVIVTERKGRVFVFKGDTVRVHGVNAAGDFVVAAADVNGRDLRPLNLLVVPAAFKPAFVPYVVRRWAP